VAAWATRLNLVTQHAQAERKYCRPHARPFRLRFARVVAVFPVCSPATLGIHMPRGGQWYAKSVSNLLAPA